MSRCPQNAKPFDLFWTQTGANGEPLNPEWAWQCTYSGFGGYDQSADYPDPRATCNNFAYAANKPALDVGPNCVNPGQITNSDSPAPGGFLSNYYVCHAKESFPYIPQDSDSTVHGHVNWRPVTYQGTVTWQNWDLPSSFLGITTPADYDWNIGLTPTLQGVVQEGRTTTLPGLTKNQKQIGLEFTSPETVQRFQQATWKLLYQRASLPFGLGDKALRQVMDGHDAVVLGLLGVDARHSPAATELHPVYALAIRENPPSQPTNYSNDTWLLFIRNQGTEGFCSSQNHPLGLDQVTLLLPAPGSSTQLLSSSSSFDVSPRYLPNPTISQLGKSAAVTVNLKTQPLCLPPPFHICLPVNGYVDGEVHLNWRASTASDERAPIVPTITTARTGADPGSPEALAASIASFLVPALRGKPTVAPPPSHTTDRTTSGRFAGTPGLQVFSRVPVVAPLSRGVNDRTAKTFRNTEAQLWTKFCSGARRQPPVPRNPTNAKYAATLLQAICPG